MSLKILLYFKGLVSSRQSIGMSAAHVKRFVCGLRIREVTGLFVCKSTWTWWTMIQVYGQRHKFIPNLCVSCWFISSLRDWKKRRIYAAFGSGQVKCIAAKLNVQDWQKQYFMTKLVLCHLCCFPHWTKLIVTKDFNILIRWLFSLFWFIKDLFWIYFW